MNRSESISELTKAVVKVQQDMKNPKKSKANPFFKSKYVDLATAWDSCRDLLATNGLAVIQTVDTVVTEKAVVSVLETTLSHESGEWISGRLMLNPAKDDPQGLGSAIQYARRYSLMAIIGMAGEDEDDDGESAMGRSQSTQTKSYPATTKSNGTAKATIAQQGALRAINMKHELGLTEQDITTMDAAKASETIGQYKK